MSPDVTDLLRCPKTREKLQFDGAPECGDLVSAESRRRWPGEDGFCKLYVERDVRGTDRLLRLFYDGAPRLHDPAVRVLLPLLQGGRGEAETRAGYWPLLDLEGLPAPKARPFRILDVGIGTGVDLEDLAVRAPAGPVHVVGVDLSLGMLRLCRARRRPPRPALSVDLLLADAHALPFADATFDAVLHVGATGSFRDPKTALAEMARVARPGAPIVVVDEQLDPAERHGALMRAAFRALTFYDRAPRSPVHLLPDTAHDVRETQLGRCYYGLRFRV